MLVAATWPDAAAIATFVVVTTGAIYAGGKWLRVVLRHEIHETTKGQFQELNDQVKQDRGATEALRREVLGHMRTEEGRTEISNQVVLERLDQLGAELDTKLGQMQWRSGEAPEVVEGEGRAT